MSAPTDKAEQQASSMPLGPRRREWVKPELSRISAGSAEQGGRLRTDLGVNFS